MLCLALLWLGAARLERARAGPACNRTATWPLFHEVKVAASPWDARRDGPAPSVLDDWPRRYPLDLDRLTGAGALVSSYGAATRACWRRALALLEGGGRELRLVAIGGSMTAGIGCGSDGRHARDGAACSFGGRFAAWLRRAFPGADVRFANHGVGGTTTAGALPMLRRLAADADGRAPDLLLVDFTGNDRPPPAGAPRGDLENQAATEALVRAVSRWFPLAAVMLVDSKCTERFPGHDAVAAHYGVPLVSYHDAVGDADAPAPQRCAPPLRWSGAQGARSAHPEWPTHQLIADSVAFGFRALAARLACDDDEPDAAGGAPAGAPRRSLAPPLTDAATLARYAPCDRPLALYDATRERAAARGVRVARGNWTLFADRPRKPGWISEGPDGSALELAVRFGAAPRLVITYLAGWANLSAALLELPTVPSAERATNLMFKRRPGTYLVRALRDDGERVTQSAILAVDASQTMIQEYHGDRGVIGFGVAPFSNHTLRVTLVCDEAALDADRGFMCLSSSGKGRSARCRPSPKQPKCKFKLLTVSSC